MTLENGTSFEIEQHKLFGVCWVLTSRCNLGCIHCFRVPGLQDGERQEQLNMIEILAADNVQKVTFAGGEPLLVPHVTDLIQAAHERGMRTALFTNGLLLTPEKIKTLKGNLDILALPLEASDQKIHAKMKGDRLFLHHQRVLDLLPQVIGLFEVEVSTVVSRLNIGDLEKLVRLLIDMKVPKVKLFQFVPLGVNGLKHQSDLEIPDWEFMEATMKLKDKYRGIDLDIQPNTPNKQQSYFNLGPWGDVYTAVGEEYVCLGNILHRRPNDIWKDKRFNHAYHLKRHSRDLGK